MEPFLNTDKCLASALPTDEWLVSAATHQGYGHERNGTHYQDSHVLEKVKDSKKESLILAVADGAGSAISSREGSRIAAETAAERLKKRFTNRKGASLNYHKVRSELKKALTSSREAIRLNTKKLGVDPRDYATTLLLAVVNERLLATLQVGDGVIVVRDSSGNYTVASEPQSGEYANETYFITSRKYPEPKISIRPDPGVTAVFLMTDGLQPLAITDHSGKAHPGFFDPIYQTLLTDKDPKLTAKRISEFITSDRVRQKTLDDVTLVAAALK